MGIIHDPGVILDSDHTTYEKCYFHTSSAFKDNKKSLHHKIRSARKYFVDALLIGRSSEDKNSIFH